MNINFFCAKTESDEPRILKGGFQPIKTCDVYICYLRSNLILCTRLSKILQAYTSKRGDFKYKKSSINTKNVAYSSMNFDLLSAERDKRDFGLNVFELQQEREPSMVGASSIHPRHSLVCQRQQYTIQNPDASITMTLR